MGDPKDEQQFDQAMADLEVIVAQLEGGQISLEEALAAFEGGIRLVRWMTQRLSEAEARVELLTRNAAGTLQLEPMVPDPNTKD